MTGRARTRRVLHRRSQVLDGGIQRHDGAWGWANLKHVAGWLRPTAALDAAMSDQGEYIDNVEPTPRYSYRRGGTCACSMWEEARRNASPPTILGTRPNNASTNASRSFPDCRGKASKVDSRCPVDKLNPAENIVYNGYYRKGYGY
jgi:hypothetical protein